jgi:sulfide:quinone oxidoreductase
VLIAGGGVAALEALLALRDLAEERVAVELVAPEDEFSYRPLSVAEPYGLAEQFRASLAEITADRGARFRRGALAAVDPERRVASLSSGEELEYDSLVIACGARQREAVSGAITFMGAAGRERVEAMLERLEALPAFDLVFAMPQDSGWPLPLYELALMTAARFGRRRGVSISLATPEAAPLEVFGVEASGAVDTLLRARGVGVIAGVTPVDFKAGHLNLSPAGRIAADEVVALARLEGRRIDGIPEGPLGFVPVDESGRVNGLEDVYAAGDATAGPVKQGGLATQQADRIAELIASSAGAEVTPRGGRPVLRGMLLTGGEPEFLRAEIEQGTIESSVAAREALWWPPSKISGRYLAPYLAELAARGT